MSERDELAGAIEAVHKGEIPVTERGGTIYQLAADELIAAGYRKSREVTTAAEVSAMPVGAVLLDADPAVCIRRRPNLWSVDGYADELFPDMDISLPATVLWEPQP